MRSNYGKSFLAGAFVGIIVWAAITIGDALDEILLDVDSLIGGTVFFVMPIVMFICYVRHFLKQRPSFKNLLVWFGGYCAVCLTLWLIIYNMLEDNSYIVKQGVRTDWINLNGIEYIFYGYSVLVGFSVLCLLFHAVRGIVKLLKKGYRVRHSLKDKT